MDRGGEHPTPINCTACALDPRPRNCGGRTSSPACCESGASAPCDGKIIPTEDRERGKDYIHSTFIDVVISGLVGFRPSLGDTFVVHPLVDGTAVKRFALDNVAYHGHNVTVAWAQTGVCQGAWKQCPLDTLCVWIDQKLRSTSPGLGLV
eukprot:5280925-Prymnesium_polylepis.1